MRLDQDFVRLLLGTIKEVKWDGGYHDLCIEDKTDETMSLYIQLLDEAGLIEASDFSTQDLMCWRAKWITDAGDQFLRAASNENCWTSAKNAVRKSHRKRTVKALQEALSEARSRIQRRKALQRRRRK